MQDTSVAEIDPKYLASPLTHKLYLHHRRLFSAFGAGNLFFGIGQMGMVLRWPMPIVVGFYLIEIIVMLIIAGWIAVPCKCGQTVRLSHKAHLSMMRKRSKRFRTVLALVAFTVVLPLFIGYLVLLPTLAKLLGRQGLALVLGGPYVVLGLPALIGAALDKLPFARSVISESELQEIASLNGETEEELNKLIDFHVKAGNFDVADLYSRKLLALAEGGSLRGTAT